MTLGLDISTSCIGYSIFNDEGKLMEMSCVKYTTKGMSLFEKLDQFKKQTAHITKLPIKYVSIEEALKKFKGKFSNADTIAKLNFFNGMISGYAYETFGVEPIYYNVNNARKIVFPDRKFNVKDSTSKHEVWKGVVELEPQIDWRYGPRNRKLSDENYDMCDSYVVALAHIITMEKQRQKF